MPKTAHYRVTALGVFGTAAAPQERWQTGVNCDEDTPASQITRAVAEARAQAIFESFAGTILPLLAAPIALVGVDIRKIGADGKQPKNPDGSYAGAGLYYPASSANRTGTPPYPFQVATVASLRTARSGPEGKGRMFLPPPAAALGSDGLLSAANAEALAAAVASWINAVNGQFIADVSVMSSKGFASKVTGVQVGRVLDTHRS
ncbi:hypothetical protein, partial [uncultured Arthrobacter sp.]